MEIKSYILGNTQIDYLIDEKSVGMQMFPVSEAGDRTKPWENDKMPFNPRARYMQTWNVGRLAYFHLLGQNLSFPGTTMKKQKAMIFESQELVETETSTSVITVVSAEDGYKIKHSIIYRHGLEGLECQNEFINESDKDVTLDMLSSFSLDNLSPFQTDDAPDTYNLHRFFGGWSMEGKHICQSIEELSLEKSWAGFNGNNE